MNNQYPNQNPNGYPNQHPNGYPNQYPNQYPNGYPNQYHNQHPYQQPYRQGVPPVFVVNAPVAEPKPKNGVGTTGFVFSIIGFFFSWLPYVGWALWFVGLLLSFIGVFRRPKGLAIAGLVISLVDLIVLIVIASALGAALMSLN